MAKRIFSTSISYAAPSALGAQAASGQYMALKCNTTAATQVIDVLEAVIQGIATASAIFGGVLARVSTNETGAQTALASPNSDGPQNPGTAAMTNPPNTFIASATNQAIPSSATTDTKIPLSFNAFGGLYRENFAPTQQFTLFGAATPFQEACLFNCTGFGGTACSVNAFLIYEPY